MKVAVLFVAALAALASCRRVPDPVAVRPAGNYDSVTYHGRWYRETNATDGDTSQPVFGVGYASSFGDTVWVPSIRMHAVEER